jgi:hypothetical protein
MNIFIYLFLFQILFRSIGSSISNDLAEKQTRNRATIPQSLTILMNFKNDGSTSFQIMQGKFRSYPLESMLIFYVNRITNCLFGQRFMSKWTNI